MVSGFDLGQIQDIVDKVEQVVTTAADDVDGVALLRVQARIVRQDLGIAENGVHGGADFVAHIGEEGALGLVSPAQLLLHAPQLKLVPDAS
jgi:hypothetical protein